MSKIIVERPRMAGKPLRKGRAKALEDLPARETMRARIDDYHGGKVVTDNLSPLRRYLYRQVGRPWNKVFSEIIKDARMGAVLRNHVREHVLDMVAIEVPAGMARAGSDASFPSYFGRPWPEAFYVDPRTGLLKRTEDSPQAKALRQRVKKA